jgi:hypothetical protein
MVSHPPEWTMIEAESLATVIVQVRIAAAATAGSIRGTTTLKKVAAGGMPRLIEASSWGCCRASRMSCGCRRAP